MLLAALAIAGCGDGESEGEAGGGLPAAGGGGVLTYALPRLPAAPAGIDPLTAPGEAVAVARQVHEPLVSRVRAPFGEAFQSGLALSLKPSAARTVWTATLRSGVRFQDGSPLNAAAVLANARRWASLPEGRRMLPELSAVDAPTPGQVRFIFESPVGGIARSLGSARLGLVSPGALEPPGGAGAAVADDATGTGTGAFELGPPAGGQLRLQRNPEWWGSPLGLGPALDGVTFIRSPAEETRTELLLTGAAQIAGGLGPRATAGIAAEPLVRVLPARGLAWEASVRGIAEAGDPPSLSGVWLTSIEG